MENRFERPADEHASLWASISLVAGLILLQGVVDAERWSLARTAYHTTGGGGGGSSSGSGASAAGSASLGGSGGAGAGP